jgi:hypothetical protein
MIVIAEDLRGEVVHEATELAEGGILLRREKCAFAPFVDEDTCIFCG